MYIRDEVGFVTHLQRWRVKCCTATEMRFVNWSNPPDVLTSWKTWRVRSMMQSITGGIVSQLLQQWQEWERQIPLFIKAKQLVYLFTNEWFLLTYVKECDKICIQTTSLAPKTRRQGLPLSWWGRRFSIWSNLSPTLGKDGAETEWEIEASDQFGSSRRFQRNLWRAGRPGMFARRWSQSREGSFLLQCPGCRRRRSLRRS